MAHTDESTIESNSERAVNQQDIKQNWYRTLWSAVTFQSRPHFRYVLSLMMLFLICETYFSKSIFLNKRVITEKSEPFNSSYYQNSEIPPKKVIMLIVDALREDFVEMDDKLVPN